jgi:hypothetical protein
MDPAEVHHPSERGGSDMTAIDYVWAALMVVAVLATLCAIFEDPEVL